MKKLRILVALMTGDNDFQREQASVAGETARRLGADVDVVFANNDAIVQTQQILGALRAPADLRPDAVVVAPVGTGMPHVAKAATEAGAGWIVLNRSPDYLAPFRAATKAPVGSVNSDNMEIGRIQGRQFAALLPAGGVVLYIEGASIESSRLRRAGLSETLPRNIEIKTARGKWTEESGFQAILPRLQMESTGDPSIHLIGSQNDAMAMGARRAMEQMPDAPTRERWLKLPITGCDGVRGSGLAWVEQGLLTATVVTPALTGIAIDLAVNAITAGTQIPELTLTKPTSYPPIEALAAAKR